MDKSTARDLMDGLACLNYVQGALDAFQDANKWNWVPKTEAICPAPDVKADQAVRIFMKYVDDHPEELNKAAPSVLSSAMHNAFPCTATPDQQPN